MGRSPCCEKTHITKGAWTKEEDQLLINYIRAHGEGCWRSLPRAAGLLRCGKSCRLRWINYLRPDLKRGNFTDEEQDLIVKLHRLFGNKWSMIAGRLPGRTDNEIKNYWNTHIKRKLLSRGLDPQTHRPLTNSYSDIRNSSSPLMIPEFAGIKVGTQEANSRSGTTEEEEEEELNLDLSISLPFQSQPPSANTAESKISTQIFATPPSMATQAVCLCCHLGFQGSQACSCQTMRMRMVPANDIHRYYRPLDS
ncbi:hypothetical protein HHK36_004438 [Tetracentron sinense]|uniref:Uncharacterized protein n=1 Tax=Tetracentron sinense TaxID=13715 RepID=A0A834ZUX2_TETSI|nr:hypothetical protein HHK36_004438 [Tetracentron sinense]